MSERQPIPLDIKVRIVEEKIPELLNRIKTEGIKLPRHDHPFRLGVTAVFQIANKPVGVSLEAYQISQGNYQGRVMWAQDLEEAYAVRKQFAEFLEKFPSEEELTSYRS